MNSVSNDINNFMKSDFQRYASNDSGLSFNSNGGGENDNRSIPLHDFQSDDLTKSLFMNSFGGNELIHDDDIYSYKSKMEIGSLFCNKFRSFNLAKPDNFNSKLSRSVSLIIQDAENLKLPEPFYQPSLPQNISFRSNNASTTCATTSIMNSSQRLYDDVRCDNMEKPKSKRPTKKSAAQEYVSSSIKDYRGDKALNDIVTFIQGASKTPKSLSKCKVNKIPSIKVDKYSPSTLELAVIADSGVVSDNSSPGSKMPNNMNIEVDSGTMSSQFVSLNNSDEDSSQLLGDHFQPVLSKRQKRTSVPIKQSCENPPLSQSTVAPEINKMATNKAKKGGKMKTQMKTKGGTYSLLNSRESIHFFLFNQYSTFMMKYDYNTVS